MKCANGWKLVNTNRAALPLYSWPSTSASIYTTTPKHVRQDTHRAFTHSAPSLEQSSTRTTASIRGSRKASSSAHVADGVAKQLNTTPNAFKHTLKKLKRKSKGAEDHPGTSSQLSKPIGYRKMKSYIQFLTTPTVDTPGTALLLHFDEKRYLIGNIHEGLQRAGIQSGVKFTKVTDIFVTGRTEWKTIGGLFGMVLTLADAATEATKAVVEAAKQKQARQRQRLQQNQDPSNSILEASFGNAFDIAKPTLNVHGGPNLCHSFATARRFIFRKGMPVKVFEYGMEDDEIKDLERKPDWVDDCVQAWTLAISPSTGDGVASQSPSFRKRSHTEYAENNLPANLFGTDPNAKNKAYENQEIRKHAVSEMFESSWRMDELEERPLSQVGEKMQAFIRNHETNKLERYTAPLSDDRTLVPNINVLTRKPWPGALIEELPASKPSPLALSYIIRNHHQRGKFLPSKAKELNVEEGPLWAKLAAGENVRARDGKTVTPDMVLTEGKEGGGIAVVDLPNADYVENLIKRSEWQAANIMNGVGAILWLLGASVAKDQRLQEFISNHKTLEHIISSPDECSNYLAFSSCASSAIRLSQVDARCFPIPIHNNVPPVQANIQDSRVAVAQRGQTLQLEPVFETQNNAVVPVLDTAEVLRTTPRKVLDLARIARNEIDQARSAKTPGSQELPSEDAEVTCLGTGSALPSKYRNVAGTLLRVPGCGSYLLDCGENTLGQLKRIYDPATLKQILRDLKLIWISHLHADHHLGIASVIKAWYEEVHGSGDKPSTSHASVLDEITDPFRVLAEEGKLCIVGTHQMMEWLKEYASVEDFGYGKLVLLASRISGKNDSYLDWYGKRMDFKPYPGEPVYVFPSSSIRALAYLALSQFNEYPSTEKSDRLDGPECLQSFSLF